MESYIIAASAGVIGIVWKLLRGTEKRLAMATREAVVLAAELAAQKVLFEAGIAANRVTEQASITAKTLGT